MEENKEINKEINEYIKEKHNIKEEDISIKMDQCDGMTNKNYHVTFYDTKNPEKKYDILFRKYGKVLDSSDHDAELFIMDYFANNNDGPKVLLKSPNFRIVEYIHNSSIIPLELRYDNKILNDIINILAKYSLITKASKYSISSDLNITFDSDKNSEIKFPTIFDLYEKMFTKAKENYSTFSTKYNEYISKNEVDENIKNMKNKFDKYLNDYKKIFISLFPKKGYFILCHNDCQRWNFLYRNKETNLMVIDHEYATMCLPGLDLCNYMDENSYYFYDDGRYECKKSEIDFDFYYEQYLKYLDEFIKLNNDWINKDENKEFLELIKSKNYYLNLHSITNVFWFLFCVINLDFENEIVKKTDHYFEYGYDRLCYSELAQSKIN
jgi:thiamine kinase-like enzyme